MGGNFTGILARRCGDMVAQGWHPPGVVTMSGRPKYAGSRQGCASSSGSSHPVVSAMGRLLLNDFTVHGEVVALRRVVDGRDDMIVAIGSLVVS